MKLLFFLKSTTVDISRYTIKDIPGSSGRLDVISRCILAALLGEEGFTKDIQIWIFLEKYGTFCFNTNTLKCEGHDYNYLEPNKNTCGEAWISQTPLPVYPSEQSCYNKNKRCEELNEKECLQNSNCGVCRNSLGEGNCVKATASGTLDITLPCFPNRVPKGNAFDPGVPDPFKDIMQTY